MTRPAIVDQVAELAAAAAPGDDEQLALLPPTRFAPGSEAHAEFEARIKRDRAGRPPGARNIATRQVCDFIRRTMGDPLIERARVLGHTPETLAAELGCSKLEAFDRLDRVRADLATFMYPRLAPVDGAGNVVPPFLFMDFGGGRRGADGAERPPWDYDGGPELPGKTEQNQALPAPAEAVSHGDVSHDEAK